MAHLSNKKLIHLGCIGFEANAPGEHIEDRMSYEAVKWMQSALTHYL